MPDRDDTTSPAGERMPFAPTARLVPELKVSDFERSLAFYTKPVCSCRII